MTGRLFGAVVAALVLSASPLSAKTITFETGGSQSVAGTTRSTNGAKVDFDWEAEGKLGLLGQEPVVSLKMRFETRAGIITLPVLTRKGITYETERLSFLSRGLREKIGLMDVDLRMTFAVAGGTFVDVVADAGALRRNGEWSFNVPGSPDWDGLFLRHGSDSDYYDEASAKEVWNSGLKFVSATFDAAELNLHALHEDYMKQYRSREAYRALGTSFKQIKKGIQLSYGLDVEQLPGAWTDAYFVAEQSSPTIESADVWDERLHSLERLLYKLDALPDEMKVGENHGPYDQARADTEAISMAIELEFQEFAPEGIDLSTLPDGKEVRFGDVVMPKYVVNGWGVFRVVLDGKLEDISFFENYEYESSFYYHYRLVNGFFIFQLNVCTFPLPSDQVSHFDKVILPLDRNRSLNIFEFDECQGSEYEIYPHWEPSGRFIYDETTKTVLRSEVSYGSEYAYPGYGTLENEYTKELYFETTDAFTINVARKGKILKVYHFDADFNYVRTE